MPNSSSATAITSRNVQASRLGFFIAGFGLALWAPLVPYVRARIPMSDGVFGLMLLCIGIGSLLFMPMTALFSSRVGIRGCIIGSTLILLIALFLMNYTHSLYWLGLALFLFGGSLGLLDVVLNIQGLVVEQGLKRSILPNLHGIFSLGTISGALLLTLCLVAGLAIEYSLLLMMAVLLIAVTLGYPGFLSDKTKASGSSFMKPTPLVALIGGMCFIVYLAEGAVLDWSALFLIKQKEMLSSQAGLGYASFSLMVMLGRFVGSQIVAYFGVVKTVVLGGLIAALGIGLSILAPHWTLALIGYGICGLGCANISPVLISSLSQQQLMPTHLAVAAATTIGYAGVLAGPALLGGVAQLSSLTAAFIALAVLLLMVSVLGSFYQRMQ
ncbi:MFS transporter [Thiopseudomonas alkaliphila]|uniref:MFS transporter n=1 Tax=Thiopseudomonas alkaliphila TaxID=1697053 RepID=A0A0K1XAU8_9GAMM|nr:MFS transporter [Thiopseudomonas alkaliphila]AKX54292.1 MFS transporter [Thiopseudomonas alkaliphila]AKX58510.1 MFS transporter [Thiopseudomonas alkaliphila]